VSSTTGPTAALSYFGPTGDELLEQLNYTTHSGGTSLAQFGYTYNSDDNVTTLAVSSPSAQTTTYGYDPANRMTSALIGTGTPQYQYIYDHASNLSSITPDGPTQTYSYTSTNTITAGTYDSNGSPTSLAGIAYKWDGENRLLQYSNPTANTGSSFSYDGLGRLVRVVDTHAGLITADHSYTWCGSMRCLAHDNTQTNSPVSTQYYAQGAIIAGTPYYYVEDRLGSVMQLISATGTIAAQYTYDPYGNKTTVSGTLVSDIGYAGYFYHAVSGLNFTRHRAYDSTHARWLNRDPIGEVGGINLYAYARNNPTSLKDPRGWCPPEQDSATLSNPFFVQVADPTPSQLQAATDAAVAAEDDEENYLTAWLQGDESVAEYWYEQMLADKERYYNALSPNEEPIVPTPPPPFQAPPIDGTPAPQMNLPPETDENST
jgi:RHS repeat-associated protein